jgi:START domain
MSFSEDQVADLLRKAEAGITTLLSNTSNSPVNSDGKPWVLLDSRPDLNLDIFYSEAAGTPIRRFKAVCVVNDVSPEQVATLIADKQRTSWDRNLREFTSLLVRDFSDYDRNMMKKLLMIRCLTESAGPISGREYIDAVLSMTLDDGSIAVAGFGLLPEETSYDFPPAKNFVRGFNHCGSGSYLERCGPGGRNTKISCVIHTDLKGWFTPIVINNAIGGSYLNYFQDLRKAISSAGRTGK